jgi:voltage-gated potassium channel
VRERFTAFVDRHEAAWELAMAALAVAFVVVGFLADAPDASQSYAVIDFFLTGIFVAEFATRFWASHSRLGYLRGHWIDLVALIPTIRGIRVLRLLRLLRLVRAFSGLFRFVSQL